MDKSFKEFIEKNQQQDEILLPKTTNDFKKVKEYTDQQSEDKKLSYLEKELLYTIEKIDESINALDMYERQVNKIPYGIYDLKNKFLENRRQTLKNIFDIVSHKQKLEKEKDKGDSFVDIIKN